MSHTAHSAVTTAPLDCNVAALERRLLELRAEIDAILAQLAGSKAAAAATEPQVAPEPEEAVVTGPQMPDPEAAAVAAAIHPEAAADQLADASETEAAAPDETAALVPAPDALEPHAVAPAASAPLTAETPESDDLTSIASIDADPADHLLDAASLPLAETAASQADLGSEAQVEIQPVDAASALPLVSAASLEPIIAAPTMDSPQEAPLEVEQSTSVAAVADSVPASVGADPAGPAVTPVLSFEPRHRKQKAGYAAPARSARRLATRVAACILALLAAATVLVVADRTAVGSAQSLPWMSPLPSYVPYGATWPFFGQKQGAGDGSAVDDRAAKPSPSAAEDLLLLRYREAWPTGA